MRVRTTLFRTLAGAALAAVAVLPSAAHATPIGDIHEGGGYAVFTGHGQVAACDSNASYVPTGAGGVAVGTGPCAGTLPVATNVVIEAFVPGGSGPYVSNTCSNTVLCTVNVPAGWGVFYVQTSSFWDPGANSSWLVMNTVSNDGYCNATGGTGYVCRAWATGVS